MAYQSLNPYDGRILKAFEELTDKQLETAVHAAEQCFETWRHQSRHPGIREQETDPIADIHAPA